MENATLAAFLPRQEETGRLRLPEPKADLRQTSPPASNPWDSEAGKCAAFRKVELVRALPNGASGPWELQANGASPSSTSFSLSGLHAPQMRSLAEVHKLASQSSSRKVHSCLRWQQNCGFPAAAADELERLRLEEKALRHLWQSSWQSQGADGTSVAMQAHLADQIQIAQQEIFDLSRQAERDELRHHEAAEEWRLVYRQAKDALKQKQMEAEDTQTAVEELQAQVASLRNALKEACADLDDARAAYRATDARVATERSVLREELAEAEHAAQGVQVHQAEAVRKRQDELRKELSECLQQEASGGALLQRLHALRSDAEIQLRRREEAEQHQKVDAACQSMLAEDVTACKCGHNANAILPAPPEAKHAEQRAVAPGEALVQAEAKEFSRAEQRQWLLSRAQKLHAVKDQLQQLRRLQQLGPEIQKDEFRMSERTQAAQRTCRWHKMVCRKCESN
ncbi:unnamed protein product [Durusdinium trenchii]|uniref:Uncharacterized protein n=1 Tax=Durusdinium trenchii TaxID=1381693 RepID=A0ABP0S8T3_9DINO